jgi:hypothetical protein
MIYIHEEGDKIRLSTIHEAQEDRWIGYSNRNDWKTYQRVEDIAKRLTEATGKLYLPTDAGAYVSPRYDVIEAPQVGDEVSYAFNGDYYPCGTIASISSSYRKIVTSEGDTFWRRRHSGTWLKDRTWALIPGHINKQNPEF